MCGQNKKKQCVCSPFHICVWLDESVCELLLSVKVYKMGSERSNVNLIGCGVEIQLCVGKLKKCVMNLCAREQQLQLHLDLIIGFKILTK